MSMTVEEALNIIFAQAECEAREHNCDKDKCDECELLYMQGTVKEHREALNVAISALSEIQQYRAIGTVSEFRELKEKATAKKPIYSDFDENENEEIIPYKAVCPVCGYEFEFGTWNDEQNHHCECGQRIDWSE